VVRCNAIIFTHAHTHACIAAIHQDTTCVVCPLCGCAVKHVAGESIHVTFDRHATTTCDPSLHPTKKARCPVKGCKEKLTTVNAFTCKDCRVEVLS
jgi:hypothetical protein